MRNACRYFNAGMWLDFAMAVWNLTTKLTGAVFRILSNAWLAQEVESETVSTTTG